MNGVLQEVADKKYANLQSYHHSESTSNPSLEDQQADGVEGLHSTAGSSGGSLTRRYVPLIRRTFLCKPRGFSTKHNAMEYLAGYLT